MPIDIAIVMLGTNDLQAALGLFPEAVTIAISRCVKAIRRSDRLVGTAEPKVLVICPPSLKEIGFRSVTYGGATAKSQALPPLLRQMALSLGADFLDAGQHASVSDVDGIHLEPDQHHSLARAVTTALGSSSGH